MGKLHRWLLIAPLGSFLAAGCREAPGLRPTAAKTPRIAPAQPKTRAQARPPKPGETKVNAIDGAEMVWVPGGKFRMGDDTRGIESPVHSVSAKGFWMYKHEVTVAQYREFCEATGCDMPTEAPSWGWQDRHPVIYVSWRDARDYCEWAGGRLPSEAEWEYAARGGKQYKYGTATGELSQHLANLVGLGGKDQWGHTAPVGSFPPNPFGLYDMCGNVSEWTSSLLKPYPYNVADGREDQDTSGTGQRVVRGGAWWFRYLFFDVYSCAHRGCESDLLTSLEIGFRACRSRTP